MKRGVFDTLRRGLDNAVANWALIVVRFVEFFVIAALAIGMVLALLVPILVSIGVRVTDVATPDDIEGVLLALTQKWVVLIWILLGVSVILLVFVAVHSFVEAGCARVAVDADRAAGPQLGGPRQRYFVFTMQRWMAGAKAGWWAVFWIYNLAWGVAGLILLIPLLPTLALAIILRDNPPVAIATSCAGLVLSVMLMILVAVVTGMWTNRAIVEWAAHGTGASASLSNGWAAVKSDLGRHLLITLAMIVIALAGSSVFTSFSFFAAFGESLHRTMVMNFFTVPLRLIGSILNWIFSAFVTSWYLAAYASLAVEGRAAARPGSSEFLGVPR